MRRLAIAVLTAGTIAGVVATTAPSVAASPEKPLWVNPELRE